MTKVLDASAVLAVLHKEPGAEVVEKEFPTARCSAATWSEILQKAEQGGIDPKLVILFLKQAGLAIEVVTESDAEVAAAIWRQARHLSLADRCCLALAKRLGVPSVTSDRNWPAVDGIAIEFIR